MKDHKRHDIKNMANLSLRLYAWVNMFYKGIN